MPVTPRKLQQWKQEQRPISVLTAWDYPMAQLLDQAGVDVILVGDSLAMVALGFPNTLPLTLDQMVHHAQAVGRGVHNALIVCDLPFLTYQPSMEMAITSAGRIIKETTAQAVKLEGAIPSTIETIQRLTDIGIPVMGHIGLTPQSVHQLGYRQQGKSDRAAQQLIEQALALQSAGIFSLVLEHIPTNLARDITSKLSIPTIGIGAGAHCDGQVLVTADLLGLSEQNPPFAKAYANLRQTITDATTQFIEDVKTKKFGVAELEDR